MVWCIVLSAGQDAKRTGRAPLHMPASTLRRLRASSAAAGRRTSSDRPVMTSMSAKQHRSRATVARAFLHAHTSMHCGMH